jgi:outer membrane protein OmpA-like peptidoglycan-associated protein
MFAYPNYEGSYGLFRTMSADNGSAGHFHIGLWGRWFSETIDAYVVGDSSGEANHTGMDYYFGLGYAITDNISFHIAGSYFTDNVDYSDIDYTRASVGLGDAKIGLKVGVGAGPVMFALAPFVSLPTGTERSTVLEQDGNTWSNDGGVFRYHSSEATDMGVIGALSITSKLMTVDFNLGYVDKNKNDDELGWENNYTIYSAAVSWHLGMVTPFVEIGGIDYSGKDRLFTFFEDSLYGPNAVYITPGLSFRPGPFSINLAVDFRGWEGENERTFTTARTDSANIVTGWGVAPPWAAVFGISYCQDFVPEAPMHGKIAGVVVDGDTDEGLEANTALYLDNAMVMSAASDMDGEFVFDDLEPTTYILTASAADYQEYRTDVIVKAGEETPVRIALMPVVTDGILVLNIMDMETKEPMTADVTIGDMETETVTETVEKTLTAGTYTIFAQAPEDFYLPYNRTVTIEAGETREIDVAFVKKEFKIVLPEVYFETAKSELKPESHGILDDAAATLNDVFASNPDIKIEVQGHTDSQGSDAYNMNLSNDRAATVKNYLVGKHGIDEMRLIIKGYGESKPVATNNTAAGRAQNRRVEFLIIE